MWSTEIENILSTSNNFVGCYPLNELPSLSQKLPASLIVNTDISRATGEHWLGLVLEEEECLYFDSFGLPIVDETLLKYLNPFYDKVTYSDVCIQHVTSNKCGKFCILFVKNVNSKSSYENFLSEFNHYNLKKNDIIVEKWINTL